MALKINDSELKHKFILALRHRQATRKGQVRIRLLSTDKEGEVHCGIEITIQVTIGQ